MVTNMTTRNYKGPHLLRYIKGRCSPPFPGNSSECSSPAPVVAPSWDCSADINAEPESSSGEEKSCPSIRGSPTSSLDGTCMTKQTKVSQYPQQQGSCSYERQSKRRRISEAPADPQKPSEPPPKSSDDFEMMFSSTSSQKRGKRPKTYGYRPTEVGECAPSVSQRVFNAVPARPSAARGERPPSSFVAPESLPPRSSLSKPSLASGPNKYDDPMDNETDVRHHQKFSMDDDLGSSSTVTTATISVFEDPDLRPDCKGHGRSGSTSSLSSTHSIIEYTLTQDEKAALVADVPNVVPDDDDTALCPLCAAPVERSHLEEFNRGKRLNVRLQQRFCEEHKRRDAISTLGRHGYPEVDWPALERKRIPQHIWFLKRVLQRKVPSYYRNKLESIIADRNLTGLKQFLRHGIVDVVKHGYYGPKGARLIGHEISTRMSRELNEALKKDKMVRTVEVGGYLSAVLVPELILKLVMEDLKIEDEGDALQKLAESTELGVLLNPDDETIVRREDDD